MPILNCYTDTISERPKRNFAETEPKPKYELFTEPKPKLNTEIITKYIL